MMIASNESLRRKKVIVKFGIWSWLNVQTSALPQISFGQRKGGDK